MLEDCSTIDLCESLLLDQVKTVNLLGQIPLTNNDFEKICAYISQGFSYSDNSSFEEEIVQYPATLSCYLVWKGIFNYSEGSYWNSVNEEIKDFPPSKNTLLGKTFLRFIERNDLFHVDIPRSHKYITPILMHGIIPQDQVNEYFEKIIYPLVTKELVCPTDTVELSYWLEENRNLEREEEHISAISERLETLLNETPDRELADLNSIDKNIEELDQQITLLTEQLNVLNRPDAQVKKLRMIETDIETVERMEKDLLSLEEKNELTLNRIQTIINSLQIDPICSAWSEETSSLNSDSITSFAENALMDYLQYIAEKGNPEEQEKLIAFLLTFSGALNDNTITLSDEAMEKYHTLISFCNVLFLKESDDEIMDISATHAYATVGVSHQGICQSDETSDQSHYPETSGNVKLLRIESLYEIENSSSDLIFDPKTEMGDYLLSHISASSFKAPDMDQTSEPDNKKRSNCSEIYNKIHSLYNIENEVPEEFLHSDKSEHPEYLPQKKSDLGRIIKLVRVQMIKDNQKRISKELPEQEQKIHSSSSPTSDIILKVRDKSIKKISDKTVSTDTGIQSRSAPEYPESTGTIDFGLQKNTIKWNIALPNEQNCSKLMDTPHQEDPTHQDTDKEIIFQHENSSDKGEELKNSTESNNKYSDSGDKNQHHINRGIFKIDQIQTSDFKDKTNPTDQSEVHEQYNQIKDPLAPQLQHIAISLADDPQIPEKLKRKPFFIRLIGKFFKKFD